MRLTANRRLTYDVSQIVESCRRVVAQARSVRIDETAVSARARSIDAARLHLPHAPEPLRFAGSPAECANYTLLCDCLNFCFWSERPWIVQYAGRAWTRTFAMLAGVARAVAQDRAWLTAERWKCADEADVRRIFRGESEIPLAAERAGILQETGERLQAVYGGEFVRLIEQAGHDAARAVALLAQGFPSFRDVAEYHGEPVVFLKRAQICIADLAMLWSSPGLEPIAGLDRLTVFADYRLPQLFRHWGMLRLDASLEDRIEAREIIPAGSEAEVEIRAATIVIGDALARALDVPPYRLDYFLWESSHAPEVAVEHHRTPTIYY